MEDHNKPVIDVIIPAGRLLSDADRAFAGADGEAASYLCAADDGRGR